MTVVGTPYYMAPESCQSEPYTSKSDIWSLGVILYELCTLKQPFQADNLLGLVFKIVQDDPEPIPSNYSPQLQDLIKKLMTKDQTQRPSAAEILKMDYVRERMQEFVDGQEQDAQFNAPIYKKQRPTFRRAATKEVIEVTSGGPNFRPQQELESTSSSIADAQVDLTPKQRMQMRKELEARQREEEMKQAARGAIGNYS